METVTLRPLIHQQKECIGIYFTNTNTLNNAVKTIPDKRWTKTFKCWYVPLGKDSYHQIAAAFGELAQIDTTALSAWLTEKKKTTNSVSARLPLIEGVTKNKPPFVRQSTSLLLPPAEQKQAVIQSVNAHVLPNMKQQLVLKAYSPSTLKTYLNEMSLTSLHPTC
jgi:integrase/recombinase XerD